MAGVPHRARPRDGSRSVLHQRALFLPRGLAGQLYWWSVLPFHGIVFEDMLRNLAHAAEQDRAGTPTGTGVADARAVPGS